MKDQVSSVAAVAAAGMTTTSAAANQKKLNDYFDSLVEQVDSYTRTGVSKSGSNAELIKRLTQNQTRLVEKIRSIQRDCQSGLTSIRSFCFLVQRKSMLYLVQIDKYWSPEQVRIYNEIIKCCDESSLAARLNASLDVSNDESNVVNVSDRLMELLFDNWVKLDSFSSCKLVYNPDKVFKSYSLIATCNERALLNIMELRMTNMTIGSVRQHAKPLLVYVSKLRLSSSQLTQEMCQTVNQLGLASPLAFIRLEIAQNYQPPLLNANQIRLNALQVKLDARFKAHFIGLESLSELDVELRNYSKVKLFDQDCLDTLVNLSSLKLKLHQGLAEINSDLLVVNRFENLLELDLSSNQIEFIQSKTFLGLKHLIKLNLSNNLLSYMSNSEFLKPLVNLERLDLSCNRINRIDWKDFKSLVSLRELSLADNEIAVVHETAPFGTSLLNQLVYLNLSHNYLNPLFVDANTFKAFVNLKTLLLDDCGVDLSMSECFAASLPSLAHLTLNHSSPSGRLRCSPFRNFAQLVFLTNLELKNCQLKDLKPCGLFTGLSYLERLDLFNNEIERVEKGSFDGLTSLIELNMQQNRVFNIERDSFSKLPRLERLNLSENQLEYVSRNMFTGLSELKTLDLSSNKLKMVQKFVFDDLCDLCELDLSHNEIINIEQESFQQLGNLELLDLSGNNMELRINGARNSRCTLNGLVSLKKLVLRDQSVDESIVSFEYFDNLKRFVEVEF